MLPGNSKRLDTCWMGNVALGLPWSQLVGCTFIIYNGFIGVLLETFYVALTDCNIVLPAMSVTLLTNELFWITHESTTVVYSLVKTRTIIRNPQVSKSINALMLFLFLVFVGLRTHIGVLRYTNNTLNDRAIALAHSYAFLVWGVAEIVILVLLVWNVVDAAAGWAKRDIAGFNNFLWLVKGAYPTILLLDILMTKNFLIAHRDTLLTQHPDNPSKLSPSAPAQALTTFVRALYAPNSSRRAIAAAVAAASTTSSPTSSSIHCAQISGAVDPTAHRKSLRRAIAQASVAVSQHRSTTNLAGAGGGDGGALGRAAGTMARSTPVLVDKAAAAGRFDPGFKPGTAVGGTGRGRREDGGGGEKARRKGGGGTGAAAKRESRERRRSETRSMASRLSQSAPVLPTLSDVRLRRGSSDDDEDGGSNVEDEDDDDEASGSEASGPVPAPAEPKPKPVEAKPAAGAASSTQGSTPSMSSVTSHHVRFSTLPPGIILPTNHAAPPPEETFQPSPVEVREYMGLVGMHANIIPGVFLGPRTVRSMVTTGTGTVAEKGDLKGGGGEPPPVVVAVRD
ncbi:hypothetical protein HDU96_006759 [Phlyctochytrium bullatum]|nr:hypothetical protein HDU96_006759 [Phlyctochytrium bullatum]